MRYLIATALTAGALLGAAPASAQQAQTIHYSGGFNCGKDDYATDWKIRKNAAGEIAVTVYYQQRHSGQVYWLDLTERKTSDGMRLSDANGNPRLDIVANDQTIRAIWMKGAPQSDCSIFAVSRSDSPRDRLDRLFTLLDTPAPGEDVAAGVADATRFPPIIEGLPELDRNTYSERYRQSVGEFWTRYRMTLATELAALPISTDAERHALKARLDAALSNTLRVSAYRHGFAEIVKVLQDTADRLVDSGLDPRTTLGTTDAGLMCQRFANLNVAYDNFDLKKLGLALAVPLDYWTRDMAERFLEEAPGCNSIPKDYTQRLASEWANVQKRQQLIQTLRAEQARLRALPATAATLIETRNLQPDPQQVRLNHGQSDLAERFFGKPLDTRREEILSIAMTDLDKKVSSYTLDKPGTPKEIGDLCDELIYLRNLAQDRKNAVREKCDAARATIEEKQTTAALEKVIAAFASAEPGGERSKAARALCEALPSTLSGRAVTAVYSACREETVKLAKKEEELRCSNALAAAGAPAEFLETTIAVAGTNGVSKAPLKDLICKGASREIGVSFSSSGMLMWKKQAMTVRFPADEEPWQFILKEDDQSDADWVLAVEDEHTIERLGKQRMRVEIVAACFMGTSACRR
ncbi:hypothetical protein [Neorhizobium galegae]|uniref:Uncharacterized protein n=1 Tax=Neorhizobium galegae bv. officinalis TaxID=323656 RepID=A0A0T7GE73_NEOGA|nr:hypothetical protein [Neorhizobium galegae]CDZ45458.1 Hypothetical protein NGAL_HAMBI1189_08720 [Neorhizobium galegae bv. officinalis]